MEKKEENYEALKDEDIESRGRIEKDRMDENKEKFEISKDEDIKIEGGLRNTG